MAERSEKARLQGQLPGRASDGGPVERRAHINQGRRHGDRKKQGQPTWSDIWTFAVVAAIVAAIFCLLLIWRAKAF